MRWFPALLLVLPSVTAVTWTDEAGDVTQEWAGNPQELRTADGMDLVGFALAETETDFHFTLKMNGPVADHDGPPMGWTTTVYMQRGEQAYAQELAFPLAGGSTSARPPSWATVMRESAGQWSWVLQPQVTVRGDTYTWSVPRASFIDERGAPPEIGGTFSGIHVVSIGQAFAAGDGASLWSFRDAVLEEPANYTFVHGLQQHGASFESHRPFRASNGEAGLFYFPVTLTSDEPRAFDIDVLDVPSGWSVRLSQLHVDVDDPVELMVEANVTFSHQHGGRSAFRLVADDGEALAQIALGIYYVAVPQPAGHHDTVFIHSESDGYDSVLFTTRDQVRGWPYINTLEEDPGDSGHPIQPTRSGVLNIGDGQTETVLHYEMRLHPSLLMGLDVTGETTPFEIEFDSAYPASGVTLGGVVQVGRLGPPGGPDDMVDIAVIEAAPFDLAAGATRIEGTVTGSPGVLPYWGGSVLRITLELRVPGVDVHVNTVTPYLLPGGRITLPLAEYQESIADAAGFVQATGSEPGQVTTPSDGGAPGKGMPHPLPLLFLGLAAALARRRTL